MATLLVFFSLGLTALTPFLTGTASAVSSPKMRQLAQAWQALQVIKQHGFDASQEGSGNLPAYAEVFIPGQQGCGYVTIGLLDSPGDGDLYANYNPGTTADVLGCHYVENRQSILDPIIQTMFDPSTGNPLDSTTFVKALGYSLQSDGTYKPVPGGGATAANLQKLLQDNPKFWPKDLPKGDFANGVAPAWMQYLIDVDTLTNTGSANNCKASADIFAVPGSNINGGDGNTTDVLSLVKDGTNSPSQFVVTSGDASGTTPTGNGIGQHEGNDGLTSCGQIRANLKGSATADGKEDANGKTRAAWYSLALAADSTTAGGDLATSTGQSGGTGCTTGTDANGNCNADSSNTLPDCTGGSSLNWLVCPIIQLAGKAAEAADTFITSQLDVDTTSIFGTTDCPTKAQDGCATQKAYYAAWNSFRLIATAILVIGGLFMIVSQAMGFEFLDAYTIRKVLPRLLVAVIGISLSWPLMNFVVNFFNVLGIDIRSLIYAPFSKIHGSLGVGVGITSYLAIAGAALALGFASLTLILTALLALFIGFFIIVIRHLALIVLIILAPVAIACYILPNTQKVFKIWSDNFLGLLMMFPIISAFIAAGHVFASVSFADGQATTGVTQIIGLAAYFVPYFLLSIAFRLATGIIGNVAGFVNDRNKGVFDRMKKTRQKAGAERGERLGRRVTSARAGAVRGLQARSSRTNKKNAFGRMALGAASGMVGGYNIERKASATQAGVSKEIGDQIATGQDSDIRGLTVNKKVVDAMGLERATAAGLVRENRDKKGKLTSRQYKSMGGAWVDEANVVAGQKRWGNDHFAQQTALAYEQRKAMDEGENENLRERYLATARDQWGMSKTEANGAWIGAGFENQNKNLGYKNTDIDYDAQTVDGRGGATVNGGKLLREAYYKKGSYPLSQMDSETITSMGNAHTDAQRRHAAASAALASPTLSADDRRTHEGARDTAQREINYARGVAETFMHDMAGGQMGEHDGQPINADAARSGRRQANGSGSAAVNEAARRFAVQTGVYKDAPKAVSLDRNPPGDNTQHGTAQN